MVPALSVVRRLGRLAWALPQVGAAFLAGVVIRYCRRWLGRPPRIWHGFLPLHTINDLVRTDRRAGFPSQSVVYHARATRYALVTEHDFEVVLQGRGLAPDTLHWYVLRHMLLHADIWSTFFDCLFVPSNQRRKNELAFRLLRAAGIRIIVAVHGSDVLQYAEPRDRYDWVARAALDYPDWNFDEQTVISRQRIELFTRYADLILPGDPTIVPWLPRAEVLFKYFPVDTEALRPSATRSWHGRPVIVHAPNHRNVKGTQYLIDAVAALQKGGWDCELKLMEGVPRPEALAAYREADIVADQFMIGSFGSFALEGLALGKPVLTYLEARHLANPVYSLPIVNTTPENMREVLAALLAVPELRTRLGDAGRAAVERVQSFDALAEVWKRIYEHVWRGTPLRLEETAHFDPARGTRALTEDPARPEFWPVEVDDLMPRIAGAVSRAR